jgi:DNA-binding CsgD family transcriptional regulator
MRLFEQSVAVFTEVGDQKNMANSLANLGLTALALGNAQESARYFRQSLEIRQALGNILGIAECLEGFAAVASAANRPQQAARLCGAAEALRETTGAAVPTADRADRARMIGGVRQRMGDVAFASAWAVGRATTHQDAARFALRYMDNSAARISDAESLLTRREREVAALVVRGLPNREMAEKLVVAQRTIETHLEHIFAKLGVKTRAELAAWATRQELLEEGRNQTVTTLRRSKRLTQ